MSQEITLEPKKVPLVYQAIATVTGDLAKVGISKDSTNSVQGFKFRSIDAFYNALAPLLAKHGLVILPRVISRAVTERQTNKGGILFSVVLEIDYDFVAAKDGSIHTARFYGEASDSGDKGTNKALSAGYKYCVMETFCVPVKGHIDDSDADTPDPVSRSPFPDEWPDHRPKPQPIKKPAAPGASPRNVAPGAAAPAQKANPGPDPEDRSLESIERELIRDLSTWQFPEGPNKGKSLLEMGYESSKKYANWVVDNEVSTGAKAQPYMKKAVEKFELMRKLMEVRELIELEKAGDR